MHVRWQYSFDPYVLSHFGSSWTALCFSSCLNSSEVFVSPFLSCLPDWAKQILKFPWTVNRKIRLELLNIFRFYWTLMLRLGVFSFAVWFTNNLKHFVCLQKHAIFQGIDGYWNRLAINYTVCFGPDSVKAVSVRSFFFPVLRSAVTGSASAVAPVTELFHAPRSLFCVFWGLDSSSSLHLDEKTKLTKS